MAFEHRGPAQASPADRAQLATNPVPLRRVLALFRPHRRNLAIVTAIIVTTSVLGLAQPFLVRAIIDEALPYRHISLLTWLAIAMVGVAAATQLLGVVQTWIAAGIGQNVMHRLRSDVFSHLQRQSMAFFKRTRGGEVQARISQDVAGMQSVITDTATSIAANVTTFVATIIAMVALSPTLALLTLIVVPPAVWLTRKVALMRRTLLAAQQAKLADLQSQVDESLSVSGVQLVKTLGATEVATQRFETASADLIGLQLRSQLAGRWRMATMQIIFAAIPAAIYVVGGMSARMSIGTIVAFTGLQASLFRPMMGLLSMGGQWITSMALFSRIWEYLDLPVEVAAPANPVPLRDVRGDVRFENVSFAYDGDEPVFTDVDITVPAGSTLAIVGATGSGKSTLGALLPRLADPTSGRVTIDGIDVRDVSAEDLAAAVGVVAQDTYLMHDTIRANLLLARPGATDAELWAALDAAQIGDLIRELPDGLDTMAGARGHRFSGGERQRLAIARTLVRNPPILLLDEATSALDTRTERELQAALDDLARGRTCVVIAHRLSTIRDADHIIVLANGTVAERGTYDDLIARDGHFAALARAHTPAALTASLR